MLFYIILLKLTEFVRFQSENILQNLKQNLSTNCLQIFKDQKQMSLIVRPLNAELIKGNDLLFFKKSPYAVCQVGNEIMKTAADKRGGKTPKWSESFTFTQLGPHLRITLLDKATIGKDDLLGQGQFELTPAYSNPYVSDNRYVQIVNNGKLVARVLCFIQYCGNAMNKFGSKIQQQVQSQIMSNMGMNSISSNTNTQNNQNIFSSNISNASTMGSTIRNSNMDLNQSRISRNPSPTPIRYSTQPVITVPVYIVKQVPVYTNISGNNNPINHSQITETYQTFPIPSTATTRVPLSTTTLNGPTRTVYVTPEKITMPPRIVITPQKRTVTYQRDGSLRKLPSFGADSSLNADGNI